MERLFKCRSCGFLHNGIVSSCDCANENWPQGGSEFCYDEFVAFRAPKKANIVPVAKLKITPGYWQSAGTTISCSLGGKSGHLAEVNHFGQDYEEANVDADVRLMAGSKLLLETMYAVREHYSLLRNRDPKNDRVRDMLEIINASILNATMDNNE